MTTAILEEITHIQEVSGLTGVDIARAAGVADSTVRSWLTQARVPGREPTERLLELAAVVERLRAIMEPGYIPLWLRKPNPLLDDEKPLDLIAQGNYPRVSRVIAGLESPPAS